MNKKIYLSSIVDPYWNQVIEKKLFDTISEDEMILFLYVNEPCVVIGRNQNPWQEVSIDCLETSNVKLVRRISGGGTVYHDLGNLNFSFISHKDHHNIEEQMQVIINAGKRLGVNLHLTSRKDIFCQDKKVSGNAFYNRGFKRLHHGTLLIDLDTRDLWKILKFDHKGFKSKSIPSVRSPVVNLKFLNPKVSLEAYVDAIIGEYDGEIIEKFPKCDEESYLDFKSWQWLYGETPSFYYEKNQDIHFIKNGINTLTQKVFCP